MYEADSPEICGTKNWFRRVKDPAASGSPLRIIGCKCEGDMVLETPQDYGNQHPVTPRTCIPNINVVPSTLLRTDILLRKLPKLQGRRSKHSVHLQWPTLLHGELQARHAILLGYESRGAHLPQPVKQSGRR